MEIKTVSCDPPPGLTAAAFTKRSVVSGTIGQSD